MTVRKYCHIYVNAYDNVCKKYVRQKAQKHCSVITYKKSINGDILSL